MDEKKSFDEELDEIRKNMILELKRWWGLKNPGGRGTIITSNNEVYTYQFYRYNLFDNSDKNSTYIKKIKELTEDEFKKICVFIKDEIMEKEYSDIPLFDAGFTVVVNYNGNKKIIKNNKGYGDTKGIYDKTEEFLQEILKYIKN